MGDEARAQLPLRGAVMCYTSVPPEKRKELERYAIQMGATITLDLTTDVTHLIVGIINTPKYRFVAVNRPDVRCLLPECIEAVAASWMEGGDTDVEALEKKYRLPIFHGLKICVTNLDDPVQRKRFEELVNAKGGQYSGDLTKDIDYLVAVKPVGSKYKHAKLWGICTVSLEWFHDSVQRGMVLDETKYDPEMPLEERGRDAWIRPTVSNSSLAKRAREDEVAIKPPRKLRRTISTKLAQQTDQIWTDIVAGGSGKTVEAKAEWEEKPVASDIEPNVGQTVSSGLGTSILQTRKAPKTNPDIVTLEKQGLFDGKHIYVHGFDERKTTILRHHLNSQSATIVESVTELSQSTAQASSSPGFILVPHSLPKNGNLPSSDNSSQSIAVTDFWVESCLHKRRLVHPNENVMYTPFTHPIHGFEKLIVSSTAFEGVDLLHLSKAVVLLGATYDEFLTPETCILICNGRRSSPKKLDAALEWNIPAVKADWLWNCIRFGHVESLDQHLLFPSKQIGLFRGEKDEALGEKTSNATTSESFVGHHSKSSNETRRLAIQAESDLRRDSQQKKSFRKEPTIVNQEAEKGPPVKNQKSTNPALNSGTSKSPARFGDTESFTGSDHANNEATTRGGQFGDSGSKCQSASATFATIPPDNSGQCSVQQGYDGAYSQSNNLPLQEIHPNSPPKRLTPQTKSFNPPKQPPDPLQEQASQLKALSSILAAQRGASKPTTTAPTIASRRKKRLLGRAASNLSNGSGSNPLSISRASSVDTVNTDGLGTPIEFFPPNISRSHQSTPQKQKPKPNQSFGTCKNSITAAALAVFRDADKDQGGMGSGGGGASGSGGIFPSTQQLEYEDPEERAWRERLLKKMNGEKESATPKAKVGVGKKVETAKDAVGVGSVRRTRQGHR